MSAPDAFLRPAHTPLAITLDTTTVTLTPIDGGWCVRRCGPRHCIDLMLNLYNWRLVRSCRAPGQPHLFMDRGWCYQGTGRVTFLRALGQALAWDGADTTAPTGWLKAVHTQETHQ